jgi:hypothetical protein
MEAPEFVAEETVFMECFTVICAYADLLGIAVIKYCLDVRI